MSDDMFHVHEKFSQGDLWTLVEPQILKAAAAAARHANADPRAPTRGEDALRDAGRAGSLERILAGLLARPGRGPEAAG